VLKKIKKHWNRKPVWERFARTVGIGVGAALFVFVYVLTRPLFCEPQNNEWTAQSYQNPAPAYEGIKRGGHIVAKKKPYPEGHDANAYEKYKYDLREIACSEIKFTDIVIAFLTYCLVVVGWFAMRSADENMKNAERAYLVAGSMFGRPRKRFERDRQDIDEWMMQHRALKSMFTGPWQLAITNFGKTAAISTMVEWGLCPLEEFKDAIKGFKKTSAVTDLLQSRSPELVKWKDKRLQKPSTTQNVFAPTKVAYHYRQVELANRDEYIGWVVFGKLTYKDVFKEEHYTTFSFVMTEEHSEAFGKSLSDDHS